MITELTKDFNDVLDKLDKLDKLINQCNELILKNPDKKVLNLLNDLYSQKIDLKIRAKELTKSLDILHISREIKNQ